MVIKKLIAISVVFALVAGTAFAVDVGGQVIAATNVVNKPAVGDASVFTKGQTFRAQIQGDGEAEVGIGTIGGWVRLRAGDGTVFSNDGVGPNAWGVAWWQPIEALRIQIGLNPDGHFDASHIGRHGFYAQANEIGLVTSDGNWGPVSWDSAVFGGYDQSAFFGLIITPIDGLSVNVVIPIDAAARGTESNIAATFKQAVFQVNYSAGFGAIHVTYAGAENFSGNDKHGSGNGAFYASANLTLIDNLGLEFGLRYTTPAAGDKALIGFGLAASYNAGSFGIKLRSVFEKSFVTGSDLGIRVDLLPSFAINDDVSIFMDAGILLAQKSNFIWHIAPYVRLGGGYATSFYAGLRASNASPYSTAKYASGIALSIPVGIIANF